MQRFLLFLSLLLVLGLAACAPQAVEEAAVPQGGDAQPAVLVYASPL